LKNGVNGQVKCSIFGHQKCCINLYYSNTTPLSLPEL